MRRNSSSEAQLIGWLARRFPGLPAVEKGIGDDAAVIRFARGSRWVVTTDMLLEGVHFDLRKESAADVGRKALNVNVSDVAAMGCVPRFALTAIGLTRGRGLGLARELYRGFRAAARAAGVLLIGGDTNAHRGGLVISVALLGETPAGARPFLRSGARAGDAICVTGALGGSILGRHLRFVPRVRTALALRRAARVHAMIDLSDGLSTDLNHVLDASGAGAVLEAGRVPIAAAARRLAARTGRTALAHALDDGEDFELLFTVPARDGARLDGRTLGGARITRVGRVVRGRGVRLEERDGTLRMLAPGGFQHEV